MYIALKMRAGRNWARITLTVIGVIGTLLISLNVVANLTDSGLSHGVYFTVRLLISLVQPALIVSALYLTFRPHLNHYFA